MERPCFPWVRGISQRKELVRVLSSAVASANEVPIVSAVCDPVMGDKWDGEGSMVSESVCACVWGATVNLARPSRRGVVSRAGAMILRTRSKAGR